AWTSMSPNTSTGPISPAAPPYPRAQNRADAMATALTKKLASWTLGYNAETMPDEVVAKTCDCILDNLAAALAGHDSMPALAARDVARSFFGRGRARVWFSELELNCAGAAFCNAMAASSLDFDDGHRAARGHP